MRPDLIDRYNYIYLAASYNAQDVTPPPPEKTIVTKPFARLKEGATPPASLEFALEETIDVPEGYKASIAYVSHSVITPHPSVQLGRHHDVVREAGLRTIVLDLEDRTIPLSLIVRRPSSGTGSAYSELNIEIECVLTSEALDRWRLDTYRAIMEGHHNAVTAYQDAAAARNSRNIGIEGRNPGLNRRLIAAELQRACIDLWLGSPEHTAPALTHHADAAPTMDHRAALGNAAAIRALEGSFDWDDMAYSFLSHNYGSEDARIAAMAEQHPDPQLEAFLMAGAARVVVPVRPSAVWTLLMFQATGIYAPWTSDDAPMFDPDTEQGRFFNSLVADILLEPLAELTRPQPLREDDAETWTVRVPTSLIWLQDSPSRPPRRLED